MALSKPRSIHAADAATLANRNRALRVSTIPKEIRSTAMQKPITNKMREPECLVTGAQRPTAIPQANATVIAKAGSFTELASDGRAFRCDRSGETSQRDAFRRSHSGCCGYRGRPSYVTRSARPGRARVSKDRTIDMRFRGRPMLPASRRVPRLDLSAEGPARWNLGFRRTYP